jgi:hypothetical protein
MREAGGIIMKTAGLFNGLVTPEEILNAILTEIKIEWYVPIQKGFQSWYLIDETRPSMVNTAIMPVGFEHPISCPFPKIAVNLMLVVKSILGVMELAKKQEVPPDMITDFLREISESIVEELELPDHVATIFHDALARGNTQLA